RRDGTDYTPYYVVAADDFGNLVQYKCSPHSSESEKNGGSPLLEIEDRKHFRFPTRVTDFYYERTMSEDDIILYFVGTAGGDLYVLNDHFDVLDTLNRDDSPGPIFSVNGYILSAPQQGQDEILQILVFLGTSDSGTHMYRFLCEKTSSGDKGLARRTHLESTNAHFDDGRRMPHWDIVVDARKHQTVNYLYIGSFSGDIYKVKCEDDRLVLEARANVGEKVFHLQKSGQGHVFVDCQSKRFLVFDDRLNKRAEYRLESPGQSFHAIWNKLPSLKHEGEARETGAKDEAGEYHVYHAGFESERLHHYVFRPPTPDSRASATLPIPISLSGKTTSIDKWPREDEQGDEPRSCFIEVPLAQKQAYRCRSLRVFRVPPEQRTAGSPDGGSLICVGSEGGYLHSFWFPDGLLNVDGWEGLAGSEVDFQVTYERGKSQDRGQSEADGSPSPAKNPVGRPARIVRAKIFGGTLGMQLQSFRLDDKIRGIFFLGAKRTKRRRDRFDFVDRKQTNCGANDRGRGTDNSDPDGNMQVIILYHFNRDQNMAVLEHHIPPYDLAGETTQPLTIVRRCHNRELDWTKNCSQAAIPEVANAQGPTAGPMIFVACLGKGLHRLSPDAFTALSHPMSRGPHNPKTIVNVSDVWSLPIDEIEAVSSTQRPDSAAQRAGGRHRTYVLVSTADKRLFLVDGDNSTILSEYEVSHACEHVLIREFEFRNQPEKELLAFAGCNDGTVYVFRVESDDELRVMSVAKFEGSVHCLSRCTIEGAPHLVISTDPGSAHGAAWLHFCPLTKQTEAGRHPEGIRLKREETRQLPAPGPADCIRILRRNGDADPDKVLAMTVSTKPDTLYLLKLACIST
ncbi:hypothetical protein ACFLSJ_09075, partial [Verrucomicrobiota bacterium]